MSLAFFIFVTIKGISFLHILVLKFLLLFTLKF